MIDELFLLVLDEDDEAISKYFNLSANATAEKARYMDDQIKLFLRESQFVVVDRWPLLRRYKPKLTSVFQTITSESSRAEMQKIARAAEDVLRKKIFRTVRKSSNYTASSKGGHHTRPAGGHSEAYQVLNRCRRHHFRKFATTCRTPASPDSLVMETQNSSLPQVVRPPSDPMVRKRGMEVRPKLLRSCDIG